jgi:CDP-4-dehydro-6-deoxyglucose reductase, E3
VRGALCYEIAAMREATLIRARPLSPSVRELTFDPGPGHSHVPGHWVTLFLDRPGEEAIKRQYSVASAARDDGTFDLAVTRVDGGPMSTFLHEAPLGTRVRMLPAQGLFVLEPMERAVWMVATGTGVAPFRAMLQEIDHKAHEGPSLSLLFGCRTEADLLYRDEFESLAARWPRFFFYPTLSRAPDDWPGRRGWVQGHLPELLVQTGNDVDVYICGLTKMVKEVRRICREDLAVDRKRVHIERYD